MTPRSRSLLANLLLVITGAGLGVAIDHMVLIHRHAAAHAQTSAKHTTLLLGELDNALHLTPEQHDSIAAILTRHQQAIDSAWNLIHQHVNAGMDTVHQEVGRILKPEQLHLLHDWLAKQHVGP